jgi:FKBP-type peptidyl-prolyl cis-trans isomerase
LLNGTQFDSSIDRGEPISFNLMQVIPGWTEGVQQMQEGSKFRFFIPWDLAYGDKGAGQDIPPYSVLIFEIELLKAAK